MALITILAYNQTLQEWTFGGSAPKLRIYSHKRFTAVGGKIVMKGSSRKWYKEYDCTIDADNTVNIPEIELDSTLDADPVTARYSAVFVDDNGRVVGSFMKRFALPADPTSTTWTDIAGYNEEEDLPNPPALTAIDGGDAFGYLTRIQIRRDTAANWDSQDPVLSEGEIGIELDTDRFKIGDGTATWSEITGYFEKMSASQVEALISAALAVYSTTAQMDTAIASAVSSAVNDLINSAPTTLNQLNELAAALNNDPNFHTTITNLINATTAFSTGTGSPIVGGVAGAEGDRYLDLQKFEIWAHSGGTWANLGGIGAGTRARVKPSPTAHTVEIGDVDAAGNSTKFTVDDANQKFTFNKVVEGVTPTDASHLTTMAYVLSILAGVTGSPFEWCLVCSDETTALTVGNGKISFRCPRGVNLTAVRASLVTAQSSGTIFTVDVNENGASILSTKLTIDNNEKTSTTAVTPPVMSDSSLADDSEITVDIDQIGDGTAKGLKVYLIGTRA